MAEQIVLQLPSDHSRDEVHELQTRVAGLEMCNKALRRRLVELTNEWRKLDNEKHTNEISDILCDFIAEFYHNDLLNYVRQHHSNKVETWNDISVALNDEARTGNDTLKKVCMKACNFTEQEWDALYEFKRTRNVRVHPRRNSKVVQRVMRELPNGLLRQGLSKLFAKMV